MVEVQESTYKETLLTHLHFILGIWSQSLRRFILSFLILSFMGDLTFVKILNVYLGDGKSQGEFRYIYGCSSHAKGFISANMQRSAL